VTTSPDIKLALDSLTAELDDDRCELADRVGSTYAFEIQTEFGLLHLLFRLESGNVTMPSIVAPYVDGHLATDTRQGVAETMLRRLLVESPWLVQG
jgi:hypothetical protein